MNYQLIEYLHTCYRTLVVIVACVFPTEGTATCNGKVKRELDEIHMKLSLKDVCKGKKYFLCIVRNIEKILI